MSRRGPATAEPVAPERLAARVATGLPVPPQVVRLGVDGAVPADTAAVADLVAATVAQTGRPVAVVSRETFLRARSLRLEHGDDAEARWSGWYDDAALVREVLRPLAPGGSGRWTPSLLDPETDRPTREPARTAVSGTVLVVHGPYLLRASLAEHLDVVVHLQTSRAAVLRRTGSAVVADAWDTYVGLCRPDSRASYVVRYDHPQRPALLTQPDGSA